MEAVIMTTAQFEEFAKSLKAIEEKVNEITPADKEKFVDNQEFINLMKISKRTAQSWRDENVIAFSQIGNKIYYKIGDIEALLERNYHRAYRVEARINIKPRVFKDTDIKAIR